MTLNFGDRKLRLIQEIMNLNNEQSLLKIEEQLESVQRSERDRQDFWAVIKPIRKSISIDEMIEKQGYSPIMKDSFFEKVKRLNITEPLEDLLAMLSK